MVLAILFWLLVLNIVIGNEYEALLTVYTFKNMFLSKFISRKNNSIHLIEHVLIVGFLFLLLLLLVNFSTY